LRIKPWSRRFEKSKIFKIKSFVMGYNSIKIPSIFKSVAAADDAIGAVAKSIYPANFQNSRQCPSLQRAGATN
jgi:hypothetical protein